MSVWKASAPSNIALIKYMGKSDAQNNRPANSSLSYTLDHLQSFVEIESWDRPYDSWEMLSGPQFGRLELSAEGQKKFLNHLKYLKDLFLFEGNFLVRSNNNFPADCGVASSASSFAALTKAACLAMGEITKARNPRRQDLTALELASMSRKGSGSSCRSFFSGWVLWSGEQVEPMELPQKNLIHVLAIVNDEKKAVSSSQAHKLISTSALYQGRPERAESRLSSLTQALLTSQWQKAYEITWAEFWDMHALFETAQPPFGYMASGSLKALDLGRKQWQGAQDGPLITMDAGANVHFLYRADQKALAFDLSEKLKQYFTVLSNSEVLTSLRHG